MYLTDSGLLSSSMASSAITGAAIATIVALLGAIVIAIVFLRPKNKDHFKGWQKKLYAHVNFDHFLLSGILKFLYVFGVLYLWVYGIVQLVSGQIGAGLLAIILAPIALRVVFEQIMLLLSIREETAETNELLRRMPPPPPPMGAPGSPNGPQGPRQGRAAYADPRYQPQQGARAPQRYAEPPAGYRQGGTPRAAQPYPAAPGSVTGRYATPAAAENPAEPPHR
ncbi:MAG: hypothetical protein PHO41_01420 [Eubacteriales bacterium]|nr:hypothetical protein [Eubacteriales bacterium]